MPPTPHLAILPGTPLPPLQLTGKWENQDFTLCLSPFSFQGWVLSPC